MNKFYHGDCLFVMNHDIDSESIDLIYLDPPFFTGKVQKGKTKWNPALMEVSYEDSKKFWGDTEKMANMRANAPEWLKSLATDRPDFASYLFYIMQRLEACHTVLKPTGSIYLHCDEKASHYLKMAMDKIFGYNNFKNEIVWHYFMGGKCKTRFAKKHDVILYYTKSSNYTYNTSKYKRRLDFKPSLINEAKNADTGHDEFGYYSVVTTDDVWDIKGVFNMSSEYSGYPTQKPIELLKRIITSSTNIGDIVLDPFCGCGTAIITAKLLNRKWIGIDINKDAYEVSACRQNELPLDFSTVFNYISRDIDEVKTLNPSDFEKWTNEFYKAIKPTPDKGVDGIKIKDGIPIQSKTYKIKYPQVSEFLTNIKLHPSVKQPIKQAIMVSQSGFAESARKRQFEIEQTEHIKIDLVTPEDMLKI